MQIKTLIASLAFAITLPLSAMADTASNKSLAIEALAETLGKSNPTAVDKYFAPGYIQHNPDVPNGSGGLKGLIAMLGKSGNFKADFARVIADDDIVAFHGRYEGFGDKPMISFDVFRLENGKIVEHWDNLTVEAKPNPSGRTQIDGETQITDLEKTEENKAKVLDFLTRGLVKGEELDFTQYVNPKEYTQHNSMVGDGLMTFGKFLHELEAKGVHLKYSKVHKVIGEGNFVLTMSEGTLGNQHDAFYDLFRLEDGLIVEHWDVIAPMPTKDAKHNEAGKF